jgi:long-chain acyl-CoA synthetase
MLLVGDIIVHNKNLYPEKIGVIDESVRMTWKDINTRVNRLANAFLNLELDKGDTVALISENCHVSLEFFYGVAKAGLIGVIINYRMSPGQIQHILNDCKAKVLLIQDKFTELIEGIRPSLKTTRFFVGLGEGHPYPIHYESFLKNHPPDEPQIDIDENDHMWINYTAGTSGVPKGAIFTHKSRVENCINHDFCCQLNPGDVAIVDVPVYGYAGILSLGGFSYASATLVIFPFNPKLFVEMVEREKANFTAMHLARYKAIREYCNASELKYDLSSLSKIAVIGGEGSSREQIVEMLNFFGGGLSRKVYGGTEMGIVTFLSFEDMSAGLSLDATEKQKKRVDSVGKPLSGYQVKIVDENDNDVPTGHQGEIVVKGPGMMDGYLNLPELTKQAFRGRPGWYYTKDSGMFDEDGYLYFRGRKDFMVKTGGFNVFPGEVESVALSHPAIAEAAMFGVPDEKWTNAINLAVVLKPGFSVDEEEMIQYCRKQLAGYQTPKAVHFMDRLPTDPGSAKVLVRELRKMFAKKEV